MLNKTKQCFEYDIWTSKFDQHTGDINTIKCSIKRGITAGITKIKNHEAIITNITPKHLKILMK